MIDYDYKSILYGILSNEKLDEENKVATINEFIKSIKKEYPQLQNHSTKDDIKELELKLTKEIEETKKETKLIESNLKKEIKEVELKLTKEIEETRKEVKEIELKLTKEIKLIESNLKKEIKEVELKFTKEIEKTRSDLIKWSFLFWITQFGAIIAILYKVF